IHIYLLAWVFTGFIACKSAVPGADSGKPSKKEQALNKKDLSDKAQLQYDYIFFNAEKEKIVGNYEAAATSYAQLTKLDHTKPTPYYELSGIFQAMGKDEQAMELAQHAFNLDPDNYWFGLNYGLLLTKNKKHDKAAGVFEKMAKRNPEKPEIFVEWANALLLAGKTKDALKVYNQVEKMIGVNEDISIQKQKVYTANGNLGKAIEEIEKLIVAFPQEAKYYGILAELYQAKGQEDKALEVFNRIFEFDPSNPYVHLSLSDYYHRKGEVKKSFSHLEKAFGHTDLDIDTKVKILLSYYVVTERNPEYKEDAFKLAQQLIEVHPEEAKAYSIYGDFLMRDNNYLEARNQFRKAVEIEKDKFVIWNQLLLLNSELQDFESMDVESAEAIELFPMQPSLYLFSGIAKSQKKEYEKAIEMLEMGTSLTVGNQPLKEQFYSSLGDVYYQDGQHKNSDIAYEKSLEINPDNVYVLNNYSYYLSLRDENLERAAEMSKKSNELMPNSASFLDTYAWILYRQGKYSDAKTYIEKALIHGGENNGVILEHYGDILFQLNEPAKALENWEKAQKAGGGSEILELKIKEKKLIEKQ
ncbi:MAG: tetratricopeptide repeat protein, partial [Bacteroidetes bacterium]|nr:tetratricopeptide repeat protein [Bacteroidota bacterium]